MNEQILKLSASFFPRGSEGNIYTTPEIIAEFAELIVKECIDIAKHHVMNISTYADADFVEKQIQEHFGVKND